MTNETDWELLYRSQCERIAELEQAINSFSSTNSFVLERNKELSDQVFQVALERDKKINALQAKVERLTKALEEMGFVGAYRIGCKDCERNVKFRESALSGQGEQ